MTAPTQAQIEAAAKALYGDHGRPPSDKAMAMAKSALAAAAEVGWRDGKTGWKDGHLIADKIERDTIERCAQVADKYPQIVMALPNSSIDSVCKAIAAEIRALKDKP